MRGKPGNMRLTRWFNYAMPSSYSQKMKKLSCKIFGEYYVPPLPPNVAAITNPMVHDEYQKVHTQNQCLIQRQSRIPDDISPKWNINYYPPHPQIRSLMYTLRQFGLYRDEHMDFVDEMKRLRILRGKRYRVPGGMSGKRSQIREGK